MFSVKRLLLASIGYMAVGIALASAQTMPTFVQGQTLTAAQMNTFVSNIEGYVQNAPHITGGTYTGGVYSGTFTGTATGGTYTGGTYLTPAIGGSVTGTSAAAGFVGEIKTSTATVTIATTGTSQNITSLALTPGSWLCAGQEVFTPGATTTITGLAANLGTNSAAISGQPSVAGDVLGGTFTTGAVAALPTGDAILLSTATLTAYLVTRAAFGTSTMVVAGAETCERIN